MKYHDAPKYWDGFNSLGKKIAQGLSTSSAPYLAVRTADGTVVNKRNFMYDVVGAQELEYWVAGTVLEEGVPTPRIVATSMPEKGFYKDSTVRLTYAGKQRGFGAQVGPENTTTSVITYVLDGGGEASQSFKVVSNPGTSTQFGNIRAKNAPGFPVLFSTAYPDAPTSFGNRRLLASPRTVPLRHAEEGVDMMTVVPATGLNTDLSGAPVTTPVFYLYNTDVGGASGFTFPTALLPSASQRNQAPPNVVVVGPNKLFAFAMADWTYPPPGQTLTPVARMLYTTDGAATWSAQDISAILDDIPWVPGTSAAQRSPSVYTLPWNEAMNIVWSSSLMVAIGNDEALLSFRYPRRSPGDPLGITGAQASRLYRVTPFGLTLLAQNEGAGYFIYQDIVYLGQDTVLAKTHSNFSGLAFEVKWIVSTDRGATWAEVPASGLPTLRANQYFGNMTVIEGATVDRPARVLISALDLPTLRINAYETRDAGATWKRRGRIAPGAPALALDDGVFRDIQFVGSRKDPALYNPAIPDLLGPP